MKRLLILGLLFSCTSWADESVRGYIRKDGTYVPPHYRSSANNNPYDNYSTQGNQNPYTGQQGTVSPYNSYNPPVAQPYPRNDPYPTNRGQSQQTNPWAR